MYFINNVASRHHDMPYGNSDISFTDRTARYLLQSLMTRFFSSVTNKTGTAHWSKPTRLDIFSLTDEVRRQLLSVAGETGRIHEVLTGEVGHTISLTDEAGRHYPFSVTDEAETHFDIADKAGRNLSLPKRREEFLPINE